MPPDLSSENDLSGYRQKGNALFLILLAVALFAALSYAITQSGRGGGSISKEQARLLASQILSYSALVESGVQRLLILNGSPVGQLDYEVPSGWAAGTYSNPSPLGEADKIFFPNGGNVPPPYIPDNVVDESWVGVFVSGFLTETKPRRYRFGNAKIAGVDGQIGCHDNILVGSGPDRACNEVFITIPFIRTEVCLAINNLLGIPNPGGAPPGVRTPSNIMGTTPWVGSATVFNLISSGTPVYRAGCARLDGGDSSGAAGGSNVYWYSFIER